MKMYSMHAKIEKSMELLITEIDNDAFNNSGFDFFYRVENFFDVSGSAYLKIHRISYPYNPKLSNRFLT